MRGLLKEEYWLYQLQLPLEKEAFRSKMSVKSYLQSIMSQERSKGLIMSSF